MEIPTWIEFPAILLFHLPDLFYRGLIFTDKEIRKYRHNYREIFLKIYMQVVKSICYIFFCFCPGV